MKWFEREREREREREFNYIFRTQLLFCVSKFFIYSFLLLKKSLPFFVAIKITEILLKSLNSKFEKELMAMTFFLYN